MAGMALVASKAKAGKSFLLTDLAASVARGAPFLGTYETTQGDVLHMVLEDPAAETQSRMHSLWKAREFAPSDHHQIATTWSMSDEGGFDELTDWLDDFPGARLVIIDMMNQFDPLANSYNANIAKLRPLSKLALKRNVCIMLVLHTHRGRAITATNPFWEDKIQGGAAAVATAQAFWGLSREPNQAEGILYAKGKSFAETQIPLMFDVRTLTFRTDVGQLATDNLSSDERTELINAMIRLDGGTPIELAKLVGKESGAVRWLLKSMRERGETVRIEGTYYTPKQAAALTAPVDPQLTFDSVPTSILRIG
jgi:AAA domain-containing protein